MNAFRDDLLLNAMEDNGIYIENVDDMDEVLMIDSISFVTLIVDLEEMFNISFEDEDFKKIAESDGITIRILKNIIEFKLANN